MNTWTPTALGRRLAAATMTAGLTLAAVGCSDGSQQQDSAPAVSSNPDGSAAQQQQSLADTPLAEIQGQNGLALTITSAERDPAGYLTVRGDLKNDAAKTAVIPAQLRGDELAVLRTGQSLAGATLVDFTQRQRYYVLRDTDGHPLTTTGLSTLEAGESARVFMQFPAPPASTITVGFQLPLFDTANITISG